jgi:hypothetical protein
LFFIKYVTLSNTNLWLTLFLSFIKCCCTKWQVYFLRFWLMYIWSCNKLQNFNSCFKFQSWKGGFLTYIYICTHINICLFILCYFVILFCQVNLLRNLLTKDLHASKLFHMLYLFKFYEVLNLYFFFFFINRILVFFFLLRECPKYFRIQIDAFFEIHNESEIRELWLFLSKDIGF